jgi:hypothetical protein
MYRHPDSDLFRVLTGKKKLREALNHTDSFAKEHARRP